MEYGYIHDNEITSYDVDILNKKIVLHTTYEVREVNESTDIIFEDVLTHCFDDVIYSNIIFSICDLEIEKFIEDYHEKLKDRKNMGWPIFYDDESQLLQKLKDNNYKVFEIDSSLGLSGFVIAKSIAIDVTTL